MGLFDAIINPALERAKKCSAENVYGMWGYVIINELRRRGKVTDENEETIAQTIFDELRKEECTELIEKIQKNEADINAVVTLILDKLNR